MLNNVHEKLNYLIKNGSSKKEIIEVTKQTSTTYSAGFDFSDSFSQLLGVKYVNITNGQAYGTLVGINTENNTVSVPTGLNGTAFSTVTVTAFGYPLE